MKDKPTRITPICDIQGPGLWSPMADQVVSIRGVVTGAVRRGFFIQSTKPGPDPLISDAIFIFSPKWPAIEGALLEVSGKVVDFVKNEDGKPVTQIKLAQVRVLRKRGPEIPAFELTADNVPENAAKLPVFLNSLESMLVSIEPGQTFIAPSNPYGDYVLFLDAEKPATGVVRTPEGGVLVDQHNPLRWFPGFRITNYKKAPRLNVGSKLLTRLVGPLNYRVESYQMAINHRIEIESSQYSLPISRLKPKAGYLTIMTMNGFNLDMRVESGSLVKNPRQDVDDDWGDGRFHSLARAVVSQANLPDIIALQEIQDNDGAEMTMVIDASLTYQGLIRTIRELSGVGYHWIDIAPAVGADGGQPGGGIRNGYLYNPLRVDLVQGSARSIGVDELVFESSRKPLVVHFREKETAGELVCVNVHLASKRHQRSIFAPELAGQDARLPIRVSQAEMVEEELSILREQGLDYYLTGDFNDTEHSETLAVFAAQNVNLVNQLPAQQRYDYNHRGKLQVLMHAIVPKNLAAERAEYDIIHGNELLGVQPGQLGDKPSDHAYVLARIRMD